MSRRGSSLLKEGSGKLDILQQYIAFSQELTWQIKAKGRTLDALTAAIETCKQNGILREYLKTCEKDVVKTMTMPFDQDYVSEVALKERETKGAYDNKIATARHLLALGILSVEPIAQVTGLSPRDVAAYST